MWSRFTKAAEWINAWAGIFALLSAFFAWVGSRLQFMEHYGWPEAVFLGVAAACVVTLVLSVALGGLAAWRYFHPLPPQPGREKSLPSNVTRLPPEEFVESGRVAELEQAIQVVRVRLGEQDYQEQLAKMDSDIRQA